MFSFFHKKEQPTEPALSLQKRGLTAGLCAIPLYSILATVAFTFLYFFFPYGDNIGLYWMESSVSYYVVAIPITLLILRDSPKQKITGKGMELRELPLLCAMTFAVAFLTSYLGTIVTNLAELFTGKESSYILNDLTSASTWWENLLFCGILAPIFEELFFRKTVMSHLALLGERPAIILSAFLFGVAHGNISQFIYAFSAGLLLGYIYYASGKLIYSISAHMTINLIGGVLATEAGKQTNTSHPLYVLYFALLAVCAILAIAGFFTLPKRFPEKTERTAKEWLWLFLNPGTVFLIVLIAFFAIA